MEVSQVQLADLFGVTTRTIQRWGREGLDDARVGEGATYDLAAAVAWRVERAQAATDDALRDARIRKTEAQAEREELDLARTRGELIHVDDLEELHVRPLANLRARLLSLPGRIAAQLPEPVEAVAIIEPIVFEAMEEFSRATGTEVDDAA